MRPRIATLSLLILALLVAAVHGCGGSKSNPVVPPVTGPTFESGAFSTGTFVFTFTTAGTVNYRCRLHSGMSGTVNVNAAGVDSPLVAVGSGGNVFSPTTVTVKTGSYVRWVNSSGMSHTVTAP